MVRFETLEEAFGAGLVALSGLSDGDCGNASANEERRRALLQTLGTAPRGLAWAGQVHGNTVLEVTSSGRAGEGDALITNVPGLALGITVADCVPVYLAGPGVAGLAHAGREGTRLTIAAATVQAMHDAFGVSPEDLRAFVGPSAGPCCYEVSQDMADDWRAAGLPADGRNLDLWEANRQSLIGAGLALDHVTVTTECTICGNRYHSFRRDGTPHRNLALITC